MSRTFGYGVAVVVVVAMLAVAGYQARPRGGADEAPAAAAVPLYMNLGSFTRTVSTSSAEAQRYFDQGMRLTYAFNHAEAIRAFEQATRLDPECAMCYWGMAYAYGPNINAPMEADAAGAAYAAVQQARARLARATSVERALIEALSARYAEDASADRAALDRAYADAMAAVRRSFPDDPDVLTLHAEAVMNLSPWDYWAPDGAPRPGVAEMVADLERVMAADPQHPGACHYYIHAVEAMHPQKAVACAERLAALMPGAGHLVHMPAHIYIRVGRWADAIRANEHAVHADEAYITDQRPTGLYPAAYYPHNHHFLSFAATMAGRSAQAVAAARAVVQHTPVEIARVAPPLEPLLAQAHLALLTFGRWDEVLAEPAPPADLSVATGLVEYARGTALAARGEEVNARVALDRVRSAVAATADPLHRTVLEIAQHALEGEIEWRGGRLPAAEAHFRQAAALEDGLLYMEPPHWYYPIRHSLGAVLLAQGRARDAETVYREDLARFPGNAWALAGLRASLERQNRRQDAAALDPELARLGSDVRLVASRL